MKKHLLDTSVLIDWWHRSRKKVSGEPRPAQVVAWAAKLIEIEGTNAILTPVYIEFVAGAISKRELNLYRAYLKPFECVDDRRITADDWREAIRLAQRVPRKAKPRQLGDCLIRAIANRLNYAVVTRDQGFP
jgi:predicted nucleic acid-binding protein